VDHKEERKGERDAVGRHHAEARATVRSIAAKVREVIARNRRHHGFTNPKAERYGKHAGRESEDAVRQICRRGSEVALAMLNSTRVSREAARGGVCDEHLLRYVRISRHRCVAKAAAPWTVAPELNNPIFFFYFSFLSF
jgi:hypothetical protein